MITFWHCRMTNIVVVDVGCRWGVASGWAAIPGVTVVGFDPDREECARLKEAFPAHHFVPLALDTRSGKRKLYVTKERACSSFYRPRRELATNYSLLRVIELEYEADVETVSLDEWAQESGLRIDFVKLDTQGSELDILRGGARALRDVSMVEVEVEFSELYEGQPLFADVDAYLRDCGFMLWDLKTLGHYRVGESSDISAGQLFWSQAYYVRRKLQDPAKALTMAAAWGFPDLVEAISYAGRTQTGRSEVCLDLRPDNVSEPAPDREAAKAGPQTRVVFMHIPKTGGTSFHNVLLRGFPSAEFCPVRLPFLHELSAEEIQKYTIYSGHYYYDDLDLIPGRKSVVTFLREPRARLLSLYYFFKSHRWSTIHEIERSGKVVGPSLAKSRSLCEYLRCTEPAALTQTDNVMTRYLIGRKYVDANYALTVDPETAFDLAVSHLRNLDAYAVLERYGDCRSRLERALGISLPESLPRDNTLESLPSLDSCEAVERESIDAETEREITRCTEIDARVYRWALDHLDR